MSNLFIPEILGPKSMVSFEQGVNIYHLLVQVILLNISGDVVEFGCNVGSTAALMQKTLDQYKSTKILHLYDSFEGLPEKTIQDESAILEKGWGAVSEEYVYEVFQICNLKAPNVHKGWFSDLTDEDLPEKISFAHLDGDLYTSILDSLKLIYPKLSKGAVVVIDDYWDDDAQKKVWNYYKRRSSYFSVEKENIYRLPGVKKACDEFFADKKEKVQILLSGLEPHGYFRKL